MSGILQAFDKCQQLLELVLVMVSVAMMNTMTKATCRGNDLF